MGLLGANIVKYKRFNGITGPNGAKRLDPSYEYMTAYTLQGYGLYHYEVKDKNNNIFLAFAIKKRKGKK